MITKEFFGHMIQGDWILPEGELARPVTTLIGTLRLWDSGAVWLYMAQGNNALEYNLQYAAKVGAEVNFTFGRPPKEVLIPGLTNVPTKEAWHQFVVDTVTQAAGRIKFWELWNEPEQTGYWEGPPTLLVEYAKDAYQTIKQLQPDAIVLSPSMTELNTSWGSGFMDRYLQAGGGQWCDALAFHHYQPTPDKLLGDWNVITKILAKYKLNHLPVYNTEFNYTNKPVEVRNAYTAQFAVILASLGGKGMVYDPETEEAANDYTDDTMQRLADLLIGAEVDPIRFDGNTMRVTLKRPGKTDQELSWSGTEFPKLGPVTVVKPKKGCRWPW